MLKHLINQKWNPGEAEVKAYRELHFWLEGLLGSSPGSFCLTFLSYNLSYNLHLMHYNICWMHFLFFFFLVRAPGWVYT